MSIKIIALSGSNGFIGSHLQNFLIKSGFEVWPMVRKKSNNPKEIFYDYEKGVIESEKLSLCYGVINLAGANIYGQLWTKSYKKELIDSRVKSTQLIVSALNSLKSCKPKCFINASAIGIYQGDRDEIFTEKTNIKNSHDFLAQLCKDWENEAIKAQKNDIRVVLTRFGIVLSNEAIILKKLRPLFKSYLGAYLGTGKQYMSFIDMPDLLKSFLFILENEKISGAVNLVLKEAITNEEFSNVLARALNKKVFFRVPAFLLNWTKQTKMLLASSKVYPQKLIDNGFEFDYSTPKTYLEKILSEHSG